MRRLHNTSRDYDWGSTVDIPRFLRGDPAGRPVAEVWMGTHPLGASSVVTADGRRPLAAVSGELPFMV
jgi:mannose-6-phosphate isomerase